MTAPIQRPLTDAEWADFLVDGVVQITHAGEGDTAAVLASTGTTLKLVDNPHAMAALLLCGQAYGFTLQDVMDLATASTDARQAAAGGFTTPSYTALAARLDSIAERIAALLPKAGQ